MPPSAPPLPALLAPAQEAERRGDWPAALGHWEHIRLLHPDLADAYRQKAAALQHLGHLHEAESVLTHAARTFPDDPALMLENARVAHRQGDWPEALRRWGGVTVRFPDNPEGYAGIGVALQLTGRLDEADAWLAEAVQRFPDHPGSAIEYARVAHRRPDWQEAFRRWEQVLARFPHRADGMFGALTALEKFDRSERLDELATGAITRFADNAEMRMFHARLAERRADWAEARRRWQTAQAQFPGHQEIAAGLGHASLQADLARIDAALEPAAPAIRRGAAGDLSPAELMLRFESLGSGCEFGLVQRHFGAEPLGLLRWGAIPPLALVRALDARLQGLGDPGQVELFEFGDSKEYFFRDKVYSMEMHTFVGVNDAPYETVFRQQVRRAQYLREKLLNDLDDAERFGKVLIYKQHSGRVSDDDARALHRALRRYGPHRLLCVRPVEPGLGDGVVEDWGDGLMVGYVEGLSPTNDEKAIRYGSWLGVCGVVVYKL